MCSRILDAGWLRHPQAYTGNHFEYLTVADPGEEPGGGGRTPYFETALPFSKGLDDRAPPPPPRVFSLSAILESEKTLGTK